MTSSADPLSLAGRWALVTGASRGIGREIAWVLADAGASVVVTGRDAARLAAAASFSAGSIIADLTDATEVERLAAEFRESTGQDAPDVLVNSAGAFELAPLADTDVASFDRQWAINVRAPFLLIRAFLPAMLRRRSGHVVTIGSIAGRVAFPHNGAYSATKFAVRGLHAVLDAELRGSGVRATLVEPAATDTPLWDAIDPTRHPGIPDRAAMLPASAVADAVLFAVTRPPEVAVPNVAVQRS